MEAVQESVVHCTIENTKVNTAEDVGPILLPEEGFCHTSNGVAESSTTPLEASNSEYCISSTVAEGSEVHHEVIQAPQSAMSDANTSGTGAAVAVPDTVASIPPEEELSAFMDTTAAVEHLLGHNETEEISEEVLDTPEVTLYHEVTVEGATFEIDAADTTGDKVTLRTEVLVEKSDDDIPDTSTNVPNIKIDNHDTANNILNEISQGLELSEALQASGTTNNGENNNGTEREEVFNKEELLDILEGNDDMSSSLNIAEDADPQTKKKIEAQIALKQLTRLKRKRSKRTLKNEHSASESKLSESKQKITIESKNTDKRNSSNVEKRNNTEETMKTEEMINNAEKKKNESIVNTLVKDWDDDEPVETDECKEALQETDKLIEATENLDKSQENVASNDNPSKTEETLDQSQTLNQTKSEDENQPQRRLGRVIKKKVIFDPDNPDTFTKGKIVTKTKDANVEKEQPPIKKVKTEQTPQRAKSKSPTAKLQWKKPTPKSNNKQNKRLTEVDKLLMDEGAVNMIYQLTPEAPKGKKNMRTKAEFIKKIQSSSTPDTKEMKFRERKKETKEDNEAKKILGGKQRSSLSSSVKSPLVDDFETHSADDSIIYRRHSSSSYSSTCMSPRRLSDVETGLNATRAAAASQAADIQNQTLEDSTDKSGDVFMADTSSDIINKDDCLSLKEKLNNKLCLALKKRKKENTKSEKPVKKRMTKNIGGDKSSATKVENSRDYKYVSVNFDQRLAEVCVAKTENSVQMLREFELALKLIDTRKDISVTLITSECGTLCSDLNMKPLLGENMEVRTNNAHEFAEAIRSVVWVVEQHSKLVVSGTWGACGGVAIALLAVSDVALAGERATFSLSASPPEPGVAALTTQCARASPSLINDLVVFGRQLSAAEAAVGGLVSRCLPGAGDLIRTIAKDLAAQPMQSIFLKKQLLNLKKGNDYLSTFLSASEKERDLLVEYWTSVEGQEVLRSALSS